MKTRSIFAIVVCGGLVGGCGTAVPSLNADAQRDPLEAELMVQAIIRTVHCELRNAVTQVVNQDIDDTRREGRRPFSAFLDDWGAQVLLTLTVNERTTIAPSTLLLPATPATAIFTAQAGVSAGAVATRIQKINLSYTVRELFLPQGVTCDASRENPRGSLLVRSDLGVASVLRSRVNAVALEQATTRAGQTTVISHQVGFQASFAGNVTPTLRLTRATINPVSPFFAIGRDSNHELLVTFGPLAKQLGGRSLIAIAEQAHFASQVSSGLGNAVRQAP